MVVKPFIYVTSRYITFLLSLDYLGLLPPAFGRNLEEVVASDLVAGDFPTDMGEGGVNLAIPLVAAIEYVYPG